MTRKCRSRDCAKGSENAPFSALFFWTFLSAGGGSRTKESVCAPRSAHQARTKPFFSNVGFAHQERAKDFSNFTLIPKMYLLLVYNSSHIEIETPSSAKTSFLLRTFEKIVDFFYHLFMMLSFFLVRPW